jgi:D-glycero-alpha-D-manno-heptose-7-phosphate kinase
MLDYGWRLKKQLTEGVSDHYLDDIYNTARANGAYGGKILGSGGGGFYYFLYDKKKQKQLLNSLKSLEFVKFNIETEGSKIISKTNEF